MSGLDVGPDTLASLRALKRTIERETTSARTSDTPAAPAGPLGSRPAPGTIAHYAQVNGVDEQFLIAAFAEQGVALEPGGMLPQRLASSTRAYIERRFRTIMRENRATPLLPAEAPAEAPVAARHDDEVTTERPRTPSRSRATWLAPTTPAAPRQRPGSPPAPRASQAARGRVAPPATQRTPPDSPRRSEARSWFDDDPVPGRRLILERDLQVSGTTAPARVHRTAPLPGEDDGPHAQLARELREDLTPVRFARFADSLAAALRASMDHERSAARSSGRPLRTDSSTSFLSCVRELYCIFILDRGGVQIHENVRRNVRRPSSPSDLQRLQRSLVAVPRCVILDKVKRRFVGWRPEDASFTVFTFNDLESWARDGVGAEPSMPAIRGVTTADHENYRYLLHLLDEVRTALRGSSPGSRRRVASAPGSSGPSRHSALVPADDTSRTRYVKAAAWIVPVKIVDGEPELVPFEKTGPKRRHHVRSHLRRIQGPDGEYTVQVEEHERGGVATDPVFQSAAVSIVRDR